MKRAVTLLHRLGSTKLGLEGELILGGKNGKTSKVSVRWPLDGVLLYSALTGLEVGSPHGPWRLSPEDVAAFCAELGLKPTAPRLRERKTAVHRTRCKPDPRQLSLVGK